MKRKYLIVFILIFLVIVAVVDFQFFRKPEEKEDVQMFESSKPAVFFLKLEPQTNSEGAVTVSVAPYKSSSAGIWEFKITLDTHSVELNENLMTVAVLIVDGKEYQPIAWDGDPAGGHHRQGILQFPPTPPPSKSITLKLFQIGGIRERNFTWQLK